MTKERFPGVMSDPLSVIRKRPKMYLQGATRATGEYLAQIMLSQIIELGALPAKVDSIKPWWAISSSVDWLRGHSNPHGVFNQMVPFPDLRSNGIYAEVLLTAFADAVLTIDSSASKWITGDSRTTALPSRIELMIPEVKRQGRLVAFKIQ